MDIYYIIIFNSKSVETFQIATVEKSLGKIITQSHYKILCNIKISFLFIHSDLFGYSWYVVRKKM